MKIKKKRKKKKRKKKTLISNFLREKIPDGYGFQTLGHTQVCQKIICLPYPPSPGNVQSIVCSFESLEWMQRCKVTDLFSNSDAKSDNYVWWSFMNYCEVDPSFFLYVAKVTRLRPTLGLDITKTIDIDCHSRTILIKAKSEQNHIRII